MMEKLKGIYRHFDEKIDFKKFIKFGITGVLNTGVNYIVYAFFCVIVKIDPKIAEVFATGVAMVNSYLINKNWTFNKKKNYNKKEIMKFILVNSISLGFSVLGIYILHDVCGINELLCKIPIMFVTIVVNYFGNKIFVFI